MSDKTTERHLIVEFNCAPNDRDAVAELLLQFIGPARQEEGCLYYNLYESSETPTKFFILDGWSNQEAVDRHGNHPNVARILEKLLPLLTEPVSIKVNTRRSD